MTTHRTPDTDRTEKEDHRIRTYAVAVAVAWSLIIGGFVVWNITHTKAETLERSLGDARAFIGKDLAFRQWVAKHGGVYVPVTEETGPNENLAHIPERDIMTPSGKNLTLMNPAYALRQMMEDFDGLYGVRGHITSLNPHRKQNAPDEWERESLLRFEKGAKEVTAVSSINGKPYLRAMRPFITDKTCLKCHGQHGYAEGSVRGGISVSIPLEPYFEEESEEITLVFLTYGSTWAIVLGAVYLVTQRIRRNLRSRLKAEEEAEYYSVRNRMILEAAGKGIIGLDSNGVQIFVNPSAAAMLGYSPDELLNRKSHPAWHHSMPDGSAYPEEHCPLCSAYQKGESVTAEELFLRKDGSSFPVEYTITPILDGPSHVGSVLTFEDISVRRQADEALRRSEQSLREAQRIAHIGNWELDLISNRLTWSDEIYRIFEIDPSQFGTSYEAFLDAIHPDDREYVSKAYNDSILNHTPYTIMHRLLMKDGRIKIISEQCETEYDQSGRPLRSFGTVQDITSQKRLEEQLRQSQKMEGIGQLAGGIAHDFNNILTAIIGYGNIVLMKTAPGDPNRFNIEQMLNAADRAAHLTKDLLLFSRKQISDLKPVDLNSVVTKLGNFLERVIGEDISCHITTGEKALPILADMHQLEQVLMNLATNARDAMPNGGTFSVSTEAVCLDGRYIEVHGHDRPGTYALLTVADTGSGMDEKTKQHIFEPFFTTKKVGKGTGLGLAVVYGIIKQHNGYVNIYSEPGRGTTFMIYLPLIAASAAEEARAPQEECTARGTETILVAEDDEAVRRLMKSILSENGYTIIEAVNGEDALDKFRKNSDSIKLLLFDIIMPIKTGKEAYDEIRALRPDLKVIFSSGYAPEALRERGLLGDNASIIFKPVSPSELLKKVRCLLDQPA
ncbi:MAG: PAS domain-containing protein [Thermodesulfovibrionales bacterium]